MTFVFVVPDAAAMISGGNVYNAGLVSALRAAGADVSVRDLATVEAADGEAPDARWIVDSLYLEALPRLRRRGHHTSLLAHYLPSLVTAGAIPSRELLAPVERAALAEADGFVVPSPFMAAALAQLGVATPHISVVAPGIEVPLVTMPPGERAPLHAILVANVVPGKRVLPFVEALVPSLRAGAPLHLTIAGSMTMDREYARACRERIAAEPIVAEAVELAGGVPREQLLSLLAASDVLVSPSAMESFGLALAEARALGVPIIARAGGNSAAHIDARAGGVMVHDDEALASECARLAGDGEERRRRSAAARANRPAARSWADAARDFLASQRRSE